MTEQKLPRELPVVEPREVISSINEYINNTGVWVRPWHMDKSWDWDEEIILSIQHSADQLLYDALWKENKRLNEALTLSLAETAKWAYKAGVLMAAQMVEHRDSTKQGGA